MLKPYINKLIKNIDLTQDESYQACLKLFYEVNDVQVAAFLALMSAKKIAVNEFLGLINAVKQHTIPVEFDAPVVDIVGTGGDGFNSVNISTAAALLTAACGVPVIKHGNRAVSSKCGSADVLEELGFLVNQSPNVVVDNVKKTNFGFCYAPNFQPVLAKLRDIRCGLGIPTIFNLIGPLCNPANAQHLLMGVGNPDYVEIIAQVLYELGTERSLVFNGYGLDELSCQGPIDTLLVTKDKIERFTIDPLQLGLRKCEMSDLMGGNVKYNAQVIYDTLVGKDTPITDTITLNAAVALFIYGAEDILPKCIERVRARLNNASSVPIIPRNRLQEIISRKRKTIRNKNIRDKKSLKAAILDKPTGAVIAEIKRASPSAGSIAAIDDPACRARQYVLYGAAAISVLTDEGFQGSMDDLTAVSNGLYDTEIPILCKDFFIYPEQIAQAYAAGADAILIMVSVLGEDTHKMVRIAHDFGLETLVEVHSLDELPIALSAGGDIIGVNQRNLKDFSMHPEIMEAIFKELPDNVIKIAESGICSVDDMQNMYKMGYNAVLVGTALSRLDNPREFFV